jgi:hypothetical protein
VWPSTASPARCAEKRQSKLLALAEEVVECRSGRMNFDLGQLGEDVTAQPAASLYHQCRPAPRPVGRRILTAEFGSVNDLVAACPVSVAERAVPWQRPGDPKRAVFAERPEKLQRAGVAQRPEKRERAVKTQ